VKLAVWLSGEASFRVSAEALSRVGQIHMSSGSIWRQSKRWGERLRELEKEENTRANRVPGREEIIPGDVMHDTRMGVGIDGWMVNIVGEGWKEVKIGTVFEVKASEGQDEVTKEPIEQAEAVECTYVARLGGSEEFGQDLWTEAVRREVPTAYDKVLIGDGAHWIWNLGEDYFPEAVQIVDWYHAKQHLYAAAALLHGEGTDTAKRWVKSVETDLYQGHADKIARWLEQETQSHPIVARDLLSEAGYFRNNQRRMQYLERREEGWPIGSGMVEGGCKQFEARMKGPGMRWGRPGAERMLAIRAVIMSRRFDGRWAALENRP
jgi:hypothetical protein